MRTTVIPANKHNPVANKLQLSQTFITPSTTILPPDTSIVAFEKPQTPKTLLLDYSSARATWNNSEECSAAEEASLVVLNLDLYVLSDHCLYRG